MADNIGNKAAHDYHLDVPAAQEGFYVKGAAHCDFGMKSRLGRMFDPKSGNTVMLAFDHGYIMGPTAGLERIDLVIPPLIPHVDVLMGTLSKAVGSEGGFVCGSAELIQYLINKARSFIFSTALSPVTMAAGLRWLQKLQEEPQRVVQLRDNMAFLCRELGRYGIPAQSDSAILPIIV